MGKSGVYISRNIFNNLFQKIDIVFFLQIPKVTARVSWFLLSNESARAAAFATAWATASSIAAITAASRSSGRTPTTYKVTNSLELMNNCIYVHI